MSHDPWGEGVHVRFLSERGVVNQSAHRLTCLVYPLPEAVIPGLVEALHEAANKYLHEQKLTSGNYTDLMNKPKGH